MNLVYVVMLLGFLKVLTGCGIDPETLGSELEAAQDGENSDSEGQIGGEITTDEDHASVASEAETPRQRGESTMVWHYSPLRTTYFQALNEAPEGYRLPTRTELLAALDAGELPGYTETLWTATQVEDQIDCAWIVRASDAYPIVAGKDAQYHATLYVKLD